MTLRDLLEEVEKQNLSEDSVWDNMNITTQGGGIVRKVFTRLRTVFDTSDAIMIWNQLVDWSKSSKSSEDDVGYVIWAILKYKQDKFVKTLNNNTNRQGRIDWEGFARDVHNDDVEAEVEAKSIYNKAKLRMQMATNDRALKALRKGK